uniref:Uncharacterized protein n=1 Tax=Anopheles melas TaxID=34690 RepID=A0A182TJX5_9DIPT
MDGSNPASPYHSSSNSATYTATDSTNHPSSGYSINYSVTQPGWGKPSSGKNAHQPGFNLNSINNNNTNCNRSSNSGSNANSRPCTSRHQPAVAATSNDHDNCNNNQSKLSPVQPAGAIVTGPAREEPDNRLNNNHIVPAPAGPSPVPSSLPSPSASSRSVPRTEDISIGAADCTTTVDTTTDTSTHTTSDTIDQRLPVYV